MFNPSMKMNKWFRPLNKSHFDEKLIDTRSKSVGDFRQLSKMDDSRKSSLDTSQIDPLLMTLHYIFNGDANIKNEFFEFTVKDASSENYLFMVYVNDFKNLIIKFNDIKSAKKMIGLIKVLFLDVDSKHELNISHHIKTKTLMRIDELFSKTDELNVSGVILDVNLFNGVEQEIYTNLIDVVGRFRGQLIEKIIKPKNEKLYVSNL
jgi:hypothetical protein